MALFSYGLVSFTLVCWRLRRRQQRVLTKEKDFPQKLVFYDRLSSNNAARIRIWLNFRKRQQKRDGKDVHPGHCDIQIRATAHADQRTPEFARVNPLQKVPALVALDGNGNRLWWLAESMVSAR